VDGLIETLTRDAKDKDLIVVVSDHGNSPNQRMVDINRWLVEKEYLVLRDRAQAAVEKDPALDRNPAISFDAIDWDRTTAFRKPGLGLDLTVNATGEEYERIRDRLVRDLRTWVDDETGGTVMALVLKREDAYPLGFWGPDVGDVAVVYEKGYAWTTLPDGSALAPGSGANHGPQFPTAHTDFASVLAFITAAGPGVRGGYVRDPARLGHAHMTDVVPTLCHLLGFDPPAHAQGAILRDFLNGVDASPRPPAKTPDL
jgi:arylsulfatase A-like enzyme